MRQSQSDQLTEADPSTLLFGQPDEYSAETDFAQESAPLVSGSPRRMERHERARRRRTRRTRRVFAVLATFVLVGTLVLGYAGYRIYQNRYHPKDFSGAGVGSVLIVVHPGDGAGDIGKTLHDKGVVASVRAFTNAASANSRSKGISAGTYQLRGHMAAKDAVALMLEPAARLSNQVAVFEGATLFDIAPALAKALGVSPAAATAAIADVASLGLPRDYAAGSQSPSSIEGFLSPATYSFDPGTTASDALQVMITQFTDRARSTGFTAKAKAMKLTPYEALIIASIAEKEAKLAADYPKVTRVILNRIAAKMPLQIDATSAYAAKQSHLDPTKVIYATIKSPYNTYTHDGLPPTPISSPGGSAMSAAVHPAPGNWLYYVNGDSAGDLYFTNSEAAFEKAVQKCRAHHWGCG